MKKLKISLLILVAVLFMPTFVNAEAFDQITNEGIVLDSVTKYYKTVTYMTNPVFNEDGIVVSVDDVSSNTFEVSKSVYDKAEDAGLVTLDRASTTVETTYKRMVTDLTYINGYYRYRNQLMWKNFPVIRSWDIIALGHYSNVSPISSSVYYRMKYVTASGSTYYDYGNYSQNFSTGSSATFALPSLNLSSLNILYYYNVQKTGNGTITSQVATGDYAHGTDTDLTLNIASQHGVGATTGIIHLNGSSSYFDTIDEAEVYWTGTW